MAAVIIPDTADDDVCGVRHDCGGGVDGFFGNALDLVEVGIVVDLEADTDADWLVEVGEVGDDGVGEHRVRVVEDDAVGVADLSTAESDFCHVSPATPVLAWAFDFDPVADTDRAIGDEEYAGKYIRESFLGG